MIALAAASLGFVLGFVAAALWSVRHVTRAEEEARYYRQKWLSVRE